MQEARNMLVENISMLLSQFAILCDRIIPALTTWKCQRGLCTLPFSFRRCAALDSLRSAAGRRQGDRAMFSLACHRDFDEPRGARSFSSWSLRMILTVSKCIEKRLGYCAPRIL